MQQLEVTTLDEAFVALGDDSVMSVELEVKVAGRLDVDRLTAALRAATAAHPLARARLARAGVTATRMTWLVPDAAEHLAVEVTDEPAATVRRRLQSIAPPLQASPPFLVSLVREDDGDRLMLNLHHAAFDGMGGMRFLTSIARAYAGAEDPPGGPELAEARDLKRLLGARSLTELGPRAGKVARDITQRRGIARVAPDGGADQAPAYLVGRLRLPETEVKEAVAQRPEGATVNDLVIAALGITIARWNEAHAAESARTVSVMMPVNMRPAEWSTEVVSNFASYLAVFVPTDVDDLVAATALVRDETGPLKKNNAARWLVDLLEPGRVLPSVLKRNLPALLPLVQKQFVETTTLSNLGRAAVPAFGEAGEVTELWFSPPLMSGGIALSLGVNSLGGDLFLGFRADSAILGDAALDRLMALYREVLLGR